MQIVIAHFFHRDFNIIERLIKHKTKFVSNYLPPRDSPLLAVHTAFKQKHNFIFEFRIKKSINNGVSHIVYKIGSEEKVIACESQRRQVLEACGVHKLKDQKHQMGEIADDINQRDHK